MEFIETPTFTALITKLLDDEEYGKLQFVLSVNIEAGSLIPGGGGLRKVRWTYPTRHKGKRGGIRVIYYAYIDRKIYMLLAYDKDKQANLTRAQLEILRDYVKERLL